MEGLRRQVALMLLTLHLHLEGVRAVGPMVVYIWPPAHGSHQTQVNECYIDLVILAQLDHDIVGLNVIVDEVVGVYILQDMGQLGESLENLGQADLEALRRAPRHVQEGVPPVAGH